MRVPDEPRPPWWQVYQIAVLGLSAAVVIAVSLLVYQAFHSAVNQPGSIALGLTAAGQVIGVAGSKGPAPETLPGIVGTATSTSTPTVTPTRSPIPTRTATLTETPTSTPDVRVYDPTRAKVLLAQAQTSWGAESPLFQVNVLTAAQRLNGKQIAPGTTFSFKTTTGPYDTFNGYRYLAPGRQNIITATVTNDVPVLESGISQVSTTLFQAVFWSGLKIVERTPHAIWLDRFNAGSTGQRGLDAYVANSGPDFRFENSSGDWIRLEASVQAGTITISIYGSDPGWNVNPTVGQPDHIVPAGSTPISQVDPDLPSGQQFAISPALPGFDVSVQRSVTRDGQEVDRYGLAEHYRPMPAIVAIGRLATVTPTATVTVEPTVEAQSTPTPAPPVHHPTRLAGLNPSAFVLPDGRIKTPSLVGLSENEAQQVIVALGLSTSFVNYQGPNDIPAAALNSVEVGQVLSQSPAARTAVSKGTPVLIAVRKA